METDKVQKTEETVSDFARPLISWFREINEARFDYVVAVTRRASNLIELLYKDFGQNEGEEGEEREEALILEQFYSRFTTDNALLADAEKIANSYCKNNVFPKICFLDDVLAHGRNLNYFLESYRKILFACVKEQNAACDQEGLTEAFYKSLTIWIYSINDAPLYLKQEYQWRLYCQHLWPEGKWRKLSDDIARYIYQGNIANTSFVLSARIESQKSNLFQEEDSHWLRDDATRYRTCEHKGYLLKSTYRYGVYPMVRSYFKHGYAYYTPYCFTEKIGAKGVVAGLRKIFEYFPSQKHKMAKVLTDYFNRVGKYTPRLYVYNQLFQLFLSYITLRIFLKDHFPCVDDIEPKFDYEKIARNFGLDGGMTEAITALSAVDWTEENLLEIIRLLGLEDHGDTAKFDYTELKSRDQVISRTEFNVYMQALEREEQANALKSNLTADQDHSSPKESNAAQEESIEEFLNKVREEVGVSPFDAVATASILSCFTQMLDWGDVTLKARVGWDDEGKAYFYSAFRNTELSLSIMPRRIEKYYSEFFRMAQFYWHDDDFPERIRQHFEDVLFVRDNSAEAKRIVEDAVEFAGLICEHRDIVDSMLNWRRVYSN